MAFVHLHNHTEYSLLDGQTKVAQMARQARDFGMDAIAITDHGYLLGVPAFVDACNKEGVKPIIGCEVYFTPDPELRRDKKPELYHLVLLAKNYGGYQNLVKLCSKAATEAFYYKPRVNLEMLGQYSQGLIASSACLLGIVPQKLIAHEPKEARAWALRLAELFEPGDFYLELQNQGLFVNDAQTITQDVLNQMLADLAAELGFKTIATNDIHYLRHEDNVAQDYMLCIQTNSKVNEPNRMRFSSDQFYLKSEQEMRQALKDFPEACDNTVELAAKCNVELPRDYILPQVPLPEGETNNSLLAKHALSGLVERYGDPLPEAVQKRYEYEYEVICNHGFPAYFLVVEEFVKWARNNGVGVGPGRGSGAGSIISYALGITGLDPLANGLLFERFLSPERPEMPDIDIDFDEEGRPRVIEHLRELYGPEKVAHVITYSTLKAKAAVNDSARILDEPIALGQRISKTIQGGPVASLKANLGVSEDNAKNREQKSPDLINLYNSDPAAHKVIEAAMMLEGTIRGEGVHASAVIICRDAVDDHVPVKLDTKGGMNITQFDGESNAGLGLLKMDFLGLRTLNVLMRARDYVATNHGVTVDIDAIPLDDPKVFELLCRGDTAGVFQVESPGMTALIRSMNVDRYSDIVAAIALFRPGPLQSGMAQDFVDRKAGKRQVTYYDNRLKNILEETYGTIVYQEQVMRIAVQMSGFTAGESDVLRKAIAKKNIKLMKEDPYTWKDGTTETIQEHWLSGAEARGYDRRLAQQIWDDVEKFSQYAFNKSHSAAYAVLVLQTAWFKTYYPVEYMAAVLSSLLGKADSLVRYITACRKGGIEVLTPDVNSSGCEFTPIDDAIRFGLAGVRNVGEAPANVIIAERERGGPYKSLHDFAFRLPNGICNKRAVDALVKAGGFDSTGYTRLQMVRILEVDKILDQATKKRRERDEGQLSMIDLFDDDATKGGFVDKIPEPDGVEWDRREKLRFEKEILKMYVSDHPLAPYSDVLKDAAEFTLGDLVLSASETDDELSAEGGAGGDPDGTASASQVKVPQNRQIRVAGIINSVQPMVSRRGERMARFVLEDREGSIETIVFPQLFAKCSDLLVEDKVVAVRGKFDVSDRGSQVIANEVEEIKLESRTRQPQARELHMAAACFNQGLSDQLTHLLQQHQGIDPVALVLELNDGQKLRTWLPFHIDGSDQNLLFQLRSLLNAPALQL
ncbi:MAG: DNA polymerase III subunit alpha [Coriobacteriales bacterium]|jgi:DNA polymerase-3 subunit alpha|nr:DNA polymerase III subunit alpha [Coriobacteriales bacterium]